MTVTKRWNIYPDVVEALDRLIALHPEYSATQIYQKLETEAPKMSLPSLRTVQSYVRYSRPPDPTGEWKPTDWPGDDAGLVLEALSLGVTLMGADFTWPTVREAERILWVCKAGYDIEPEIAWAVARFYLLRESRQQSTKSLDLFLGFRAWKQLDLWKIYVESTGVSELEPGLMHLMSLIHKEHSAELTGVKESANV